MIILITLLLSSLLTILIFFAAMFVSAKPVVLLLLAALLGYILCFSCLHYFSKTTLNIKMLSVVPIITLLIFFSYLSFQPNSLKAQTSTTYPDGLQFWELESGSRIAFRKFENTSTTKKTTPIIVLHGGPGAYMLSQKSLYPLYQRISDEGYDVYLYDQVGGGFSSRLSDVSDYTAERQVEDLELIRREIGTEQVILLAQSWSTILASHYLASYPDAIEKIVFASPSALNMTDWVEVGRGNVVDRLTDEQKDTLSNTYSTLRTDIAEVLMLVNPQAVKNLFGDAELDYMLDESVQVASAALTCDTTKGLSSEIKGMGFFANQQTIRDLKEGNYKLQEKLSQLETKVLILRGSCDYLREELAQEFIDTFKHAQFVSMPNVGHSITTDAPEAYVELVTRFLGNDTKR